MSTDDCITGLFIHVDTVMADVPKHPNAKLDPSEVVTLALLFALKGVSQRAFAPLAVEHLSRLVPGLAGPHAPVPFVRRAC